MADKILAFLLISLSDCTHRSPSIIQVNPYHIVENKKHPNLISTYISKVKSG